MKYMMFATRFPATHPRAGQPTRFPEKMWNNRRISGPQMTKEDILFLLLTEAKLPGVFDPGMVNEPDISNCSKGHTIRGGNRWKAGDMFSPRVWVGKPYYSKQVEFMPPIKVVATYQIKIQYTDSRKSLVIWLDNNLIQMISLSSIDNMLQLPVAHNDGLLPADFKGWFPKAFEGQLICWDAQMAEFYNALIKTKK